jgi:hypothetical protein
MPPGAQPYKVCFARNPTEKTLEDMTAEDFDRQIDMTVKVSGPDPGQAVDQCVLTRKCVITLTGYDMDDYLHSRLAAVAPGAKTPCGNDLVEPVETLLGPKYPDHFKAPNEYDMGTTTTIPASNSYTLCWGHNVQPSTDEDAKSTGVLDYNLEVTTTFTVAGPKMHAKGDLVCTLTVTCHLNVFGYGLLDLDDVYMIAVAGDCGDRSARLLKGFVLPARPSSSQTIVGDGTANSKQEYILNPTTEPVSEAPGNTYKLCWTADRAEVEDSRDQERADCPDRRACH